MLSLALCPGHCYNPTSGLAAALTRVKIPFLVCIERQTFRTRHFLVLGISLTEVEELRQPHTGMTQSGH